MRLELSGREIQARNTEEITVGNFDMGWCKENNYAHANYQYPIEAFRWYGIGGDPRIPGLYGTTLPASTFIGKAADYCHLPPRFGIPIDYPHCVKSTYFGTTTRNTDRRVPLWDCVHTYTPALGFAATARSAHGLCKTYHTFS